MSDEREFLDKDGAAALFCISVSMINKLVNNNSIPHLHIGRRVIFKKSELENWIASQPK